MNLRRSDCPVCQGLVMIRTHAEALAHEDAHHPAPRVRWARTHGPWHALVNLNARTTACGQAMGAIYREADSPERRDRCLTCDRLASVKATQTGAAR